MFSVSNTRIDPTVVIPESVGKVIVAVVLVHFSPRKRQMPSNLRRSEEGLLFIGA